jgi:hypothetical protein
MATRPDEEVRLDPVSMPKEYPGTEALADAQSVMQTAANGEESRFDSLNTRAVAVLSATSLVTALAGIYGKDVVDGTYTSWTRVVGTLGLVVTLVLLITVATVVVKGVLVPKTSLFFGDNDLTDHPSRITTALELRQLVFDEYRRVHMQLLARNEEKAEALTWGYRILLSAVIAIALTVGAISIGRL